MYLQDNNDGWLQVTLKDPVLDLETVEVPDEMTKERVIQDIWDQPYNLSKPFVKYRLIVLPDGSRFLAIKLDHAMYDGTLLRIFDSQFVAMARQEPIEEPVPFQTFTDYIHGLDKSKPLAFWTELLKGNTFSYPTVSQQPRVSGTVLRKVNSRVDTFAPQCGSTVSIAFQAAFSLLLRRLSSSDDVSYDNLVTGRNVELEDAQMINGTCANFIPFRSSLQPHTTVQSLLKDTQSLFWKTTENGTVGLDDIYRALSVDRQTNGNKCLFLFQPFEPASGPIDHMRWIVMALSKVTMPINYALMLEVLKTSTGYTLRLKYDSRVYSTEAAEAVGDMLVGIIDGMLEDPQTRLDAL
ncbi:hypothetical protein JB92DRAFT_851690 [Gautieria morchelliformis]|nr:hypothetical protein JB92DRAFT_851690 [Gautieria morchelliformis]